jgi:hypothetical protein
MFLSRGKNDEKKLAKISQITQIFLCSWFWGTAVKSLSLRDSYAIKDSYERSLCADCADFFGEDAIGLLVKDR